MCLLAFFLEKAGYAETLATKSNVEYQISLSNKPNFIYGTHNNAQEINNMFDYDLIDAVVEKYVNGSFQMTYVFGLKVKNFQIDVHGRLFNDNNYARNFLLRDTDFYKFMYLIFGETYKSALIEHLKTTCKEKLKEESNTYLRNLNNSKSSLHKKIMHKRSHEFARNGILKTYRDRIDFATALNMSELTLN